MTRLLTLCAPAALLLALPLAAAAAPPNPLRGQVPAQGQAAYNQHCAQCHGLDARKPMAEAPDLRRLNSFCLRLREAALKERCLGDVDAYYLGSVLDGKVRAGVVHMPPWRDRLDESTLWAIRSYIEAQPLPPPRSQTSVDAAHSSGP
jgi:mono/diheme cytochrome c family protein